MRTRWPSTISRSGAPPAYVSGSADSTTSNHARRAPPAPSRGSLDGGALEAAVSSGAVESGRIGRRTNEGRGDEGAAKGDENYERNSAESIHREG